MQNSTKFIVALLGTAVVGTAVGVSTGSFFSSKETPIPNSGSESMPLAAAGETFETTVTTDGVGKILVQVELPPSPRYTEGAPVVVNVPTYFTPEISGFHPLEGLTEAGAISISLMYPGRSDGQGNSSEGTDDYGGANSIKALRDVLLFALGDKTNSDGYSLKELSAIAPLSTDVGLYAFSHPGIAATEVLGTYPDELKDVAFFVGRENPTLDLTSSMELGHWDSQGKAKIPVPNLLYEYPRDYSSSSIDLDYSSINYDQATDSPYFDTNTNGKLDKSEFSLGTQVPKMFGKRYYSRQLLHALQDNGVFTDSTWPADLATPEEADQTWASREPQPYYSKISGALHVMLVFAVQDHVQVLQDKPHVHQAYDGFHGAGLWTRLNPDQAYVAAFNPQAAAKYTEHAANTEPSDWKAINSWAYANASGITVPLAGVLEMADRAHTNNWTDELDNILQ